MDTSLIWGIGSAKTFDGGVGKLCLDIKNEGFEPAIWVAPFIAEEKSELFQHHPDWFVKDDDGKPLASNRVSFGGWRCAPWYMLDGTHPEARAYLTHVFKTMREQWGVKYFKLDANMWVALPFGKPSKVMDFWLGEDLGIWERGEQIIQVAGYCARALRILECRKE